MGSVGELFGIKKPEKTEIPEPPPPVEEVGASKEMLKTKAKERKGRRSTILGSQALGSSNSGKKTILG